MLKLEVENVAWKVKANEQQRMVDQMLTNGEDHSTSASSSSSSSSSPSTSSSDVALLRREMLRREHENNVAQTKLQAHLLRVRGRVHVKVRVRPANSEESRYKAVSEAVGDKELAFMDPRSDRWRPFAFDGVHGVTASQSEVFHDLAALSTLVVDGYCCGVMAYGQTGSGKTHTMQGTSADPGINVRTLQKVFDTIRRRSMNPLGKYEYQVELSMMEIYNEEVLDLLPPSHTRLTTTKLASRQGKQKLEVVCVR